MRSYGKYLGKDRSNPHRFLFHAWPAPLAVEKETGPEKKKYPGGCGVLSRVLCTVELGLALAKICQNVPL